MRTPRVLLTVVLVLAVPSAAAGSLRDASSLGSSGQVVTGASAPSSTSGHAPSSTTASCPTFPAHNWWHADVSMLPVHARSAQWLSHMSADRDLHPDFGPSYGDGPNYGIPVTVVDGTHAKVKVRFDYASESDKVRYPLGSDTRIEGG